MDKRGANRIAAVDELLQEKRWAAFEASLVAPAGNTTGRKEIGTWPPSPVELRPPYRDCIVVRGGTTYYFSTPPRHADQRERRYRCCDRGGAVGSSSDR